ncbi:hypothetical protein BJ741DRAFT_703844 [Chytriomyces cf. hyalinus JEL632]|nr:hypothetical protein BJ741DRAFT_703844 [Chytriomyces cf. hyalinus JEL632]
MDLRDRAIEVSTTTSDALLNVVNESSVGLFRIQEHVLKKTGVIVAEKKNAIELNSLIELSLADALEAKQICLNASKVHGLLSSLDALRRVIAKHSPT